MASPQVEQKRALSGREEAQDLHRNIVWRKTNRRWLTMIPQAGNLLGQVLALIFIDFFPPLTFPREKVQTTESAWNGCGPSPDRAFKRISFRDFIETFTYGRRPVLLQVRFDSGDRGQRGTNR